MRFGLIAGEISGDWLGADLIRALHILYPQATFEGIGGPQMITAGFHSHYPLETLSVMGLVEVIKHFPRLKQCRDSLRDYFLQHPPTVFIGIDAPDFNLGLETSLKAAGIPTIHYVSPSVWAWREYRLHKIAQACDLMLTLFPFEAEYYQRHHLPVLFVGHPLADTIPLHSDQLAARKELGLVETGTYIALLPGSRLNEVRKLGYIFLQTAQWLLTRCPTLKFIVPLASPHLQSLFTQQLQTLDATELPLTWVLGQSHQVMAAADLILTASGTATLEAMLFKRPMVVAYRLAEISYWLAKLLVKVPYFSLPNLLAKERLVPEFLQHEVNPEQLGAAILEWLTHPQQVECLQHRFLELHLQLRQGASQRAAEGIKRIVELQTYHPMPNFAGV